MPGRLRSHVHVNDDSGRTHVFGPGDQVPDWAAQKITNPKAWAQAPYADPGGQDETAAGQGQSPGDQTGRPAASASKDVWAAYASVLGVQIPPGATKAEITAAVEAAEADQ